MGFCGAFQEHSGLYQSGHGYRVYAPLLMRFNRPDVLSPYGEGGLNPYIYCGADPVNRTDPSGLFFQHVLARLRGFKRTLQSFARPRAEVLFFDDVSTVGLSKTTFFVDAHGDIGKTTFNNMELTPERLANTIMENPQARKMLERSNKVELISCFGADAAENTPAVAQQLATHFRRPVVAYSGETTGWSGLSYYKHAHHKARHFDYSRPAPTSAGLRKPQVLGTDNKWPFYRRHVFQPRT